MDKIRQIVEKEDAVAEENTKRDTKLEDLDTYTTTLFDKHERLEVVFKNTRQQIHQDFLEFHGKITEDLEKFQQKLRTFPEKID